MGDDLGHHPFLSRVAMGHDNERSARRDGEILEERLERLEASCRSSDGYDVELIHVRAPASYPRTGTAALHDPRAAPFHESRLKPTSVTKSNALT
jgi:hypothetical protein